jgi:hypothetical protein
MENNEENEIRLRTELSENACTFDFGVTSKLSLLVESHDWFINGTFKPARRSSDTVTPVLDYFEVNHVERVLHAMIEDHPSSGDHHPSFGDYPSLRRTIYGILYTGRYAQPDYFCNSSNFSRVKVFVENDSTTLIHYMLRLLTVVDTITVSVITLDLCFQKF